MNSKNVGASVYAKLRNIAKERRMDTSVLLRRYAQERLLYRMSVSTVAEEFCLKGGVLMSAYNDGNLLRPTEDIDFNGFRKGAGVDDLRKALSVVLATEVEDDGVEFEIGTMTIEKDRTGLIGGGKIRMSANVHTAKVDLRVDVGFGNPITPGVRFMEMPTLLGDVAPRPMVLAYPLETVFSEKLHAMAAFGAANTRLKDFYDLYLIVGMHGFECRDLVAAVRNTFEAQERDIPETLPACLTPEFAEDKAASWRVFLDRIDERDPLELAEVVAELSAFVEPVIAAARDGAENRLEWTPGGGWREATGTSVTLA